MARRKLQAPRRCKALAKDGAPCRSPFVEPDTGFCKAHGPGGPAVMRARGRRGAEATIRKYQGRGTVKPGDAPSPPDTIEDAKLIAAWATRAVLVGEIDPRIAREVTNLLREFRAAAKELDLERKLAALEDQVSALKARGKGGTR